MSKRRSKSRGTGSDASGTSEVGKVPLPVRTTPCKAFGHTEGRTRRGDCRACHRLKFEVWKKTLAGRASNRRHTSKYRKTPKGKAAKQRRDRARGKRLWATSPEFRMNNETKGFKRRLRHRIENKRIKIVQLESALKEALGG